MDGTPGSPDSALWARVPGHLTPSAATLAIVGDYVSGAVSQPLGRRAMGRSLDNTLRMVQVKPTEWVLCDIRIHALVGGYAQGIAFLWSEDGRSPGDGEPVDRREAVAGGRRPAPSHGGALTFPPAEQRNWSSWLVTPQLVGGARPAESMIVAGTAAVAVLGGALAFAAVERSASNPPRHRIGDPARHPTTTTTAPVAAASTTTSTTTDVPGPAGPGFIPGR